MEPPSGEKQDTNTSTSGTWQRNSAFEDGGTGKRVLVTGGAGFIGSHLVDALVADNEVVVFDDLSSGSYENVNSAVTFIKGDLREDSPLASLVKQADVVFHQAGLVSVETTVSEPLRSNRINAMGTLRVLNAARQGDTRVVTASSAAIYGSPETVPIPETAAPDPQSPYGVDKHTADQYTRLYAGLYGLETVALRYFNVYGPRQTADDYSGVIAAFLDRVRRDEPLCIHGDGTQTRDFVHVRDVVDANLQAAQTKETGLAYNIGTGTETSINELASICRQLASKDPGCEHVDGRPGDVPRSCADISRAQNHLGFEPSVGLESGLSTLFDAKSSIPSTPDS